jgi:putative sugar O-methyltransferase
MIVNNAFIHPDPFINSSKFIQILRKSNFETQAISQIIAMTGKVELLSKFLDLIDIQEFLVLSTLTGQIKSLEFLYKRGFNIKNSLQLANAIGQVEIQEYFKQLDENIHVIDTNTDNNIALIAAVVSGHLSIVKQHHEQQGHEITTGLAPAAATGQLEILKYLHTQGVNINNAIVPAATAGQLEILKYLDTQGVDINNAIVPAATAGQLEILKYLHTQGIDINNAIVPAAAARQSDVIKYLHENNMISSELSEESSARLLEMSQEILESDSIYHPSQFWNILGTSQKDHLRFGGEKNFKRTINQSYCNFIPKSLNDPLIVHLNNTLPTLKSNAVYTLEDPDNDPDLWFSFYRDYHVFSEDRELRKKLYCEFVSKLYEYALTTEEADTLNSLEEPEIGNPIRILRDGKLISQDLVTSVMERGLVMKYLKKQKSTSPYIIGELGAGYGRLAYVFLKTTPCRYIIFDIPPALHIAEWYLSTLFPEKNIFKFRHFENYEKIEAELTLANIAFFTPNQMALFPEGYFDAFITISSLHEMFRKQIAHFIELISLATRKILYIKQYWEYINPHDNLKILDSEYILPDNYIAEKKQDILNPLFFEMVATKKRPTVSILLSNYNHGIYLQDSLSAFCEQTMPAFEIIIIDDGSTDNSVEVIGRFKNKYPNISLLQNEKNKGVVYSINRTLEVAKGDYIVWASADDKLLPNFIEKNVSCLETFPGAGLCFSRLAVFEDGTNIERHYTEENYGLAFDLGKENHYLNKAALVNRLQKSYLWMSGNTVVARRRALVAMGGFAQNLHWHADWFAFYAIALRYGVCIIPETLALMRERPNTYSKRGMSDPIKQQKVLTTIIRTVYNKENKDIFPAFAACPCLFSPFGTPMLKAFSTKPQYWKLFWSYLTWYLFQHQKYHKRIINKGKKIIRKILGRGNYPKSEVNTETPKEK